LNQAELIHRRKWDHLVILDSARYDHFEQEVWRYLDGHLEEAHSPFGGTLGWLKGTWRGSYNLCYYSTIPLVNSRVPLYGFDARVHFREIVDLWDSAWDEELSTVPPWNVNRAVLSHRRPRSVVHYAQPHGPWIGETKLTVRGVKHRIVSSRPFFVLRPEGAPYHADGMVIRYMVRQGKVDVETLRRAYRDNLRLVLEHARELVDGLEGKIVLSSDHGEFLGEHGLFGHGEHLPKLPELTRVPWFEVMR